MSLYKQKFFLIKILLVLVSLGILFMVFNSIIIGKKDTQIHTKDNKILDPVKAKVKTGSIPDLGNSELMVNNLTFKSKTKDHKSYTIIASKALKLHNETYYINDIKAIIGAGDEAVNILANSGKYDDEIKLLKLQDKIKAQYDGYILKTDNLIIDIMTQEYISPSPVIIEEDDATISANSFRTREQQNIIEFEGDVKTIINFSN